MRPTILLVDDDDLSRSATSRMMNRLGYDVLQAKHGAEAIRMIDGESAPIDAVVTDVYMPGLRGSELAEILAAIRPEVPVLFVSGYEDEDMARCGVDTNRGFLHKPFGMSDLKDAMASILKPLPFCS